MTVEDFLEASHKLRVQQQAVKEEEEDRADELEVEEHNNLRQASVSSKVRAKLPQRAGLKKAIAQTLAPVCSSIVLW